MGYLIHRRRMVRTERRAEAHAAAQRAAAVDAPAGSMVATAMPVVDLAALHRSLALKKKAIPILVAFARELAGTNRADSPPLSSGEVPAFCEGGGVMSESVGSPPGVERLPAEPPPLEPPSRVRFEYVNGSMLAIDTQTGGLADSATALIEWMRKRP